MTLDLYKYRCSGGNGDYYSGYISHKNNDVEEMKKSLIKAYHSIVEFELVEFRGVVVITRKQ